MKPSKRKIPDYVLCHGPLPLSDGVYFRVEVHPKGLLPDLVTFPVHAVTGPGGLLDHEVAWAVGLNIIDDFLNGLLPGTAWPGAELNGIRTDPKELSQSIRNASTNTEIYHVGICPTCSEIVKASDTPLQLGEPPPSAENDLIPLRCSREHAFERRGKELSFQVIPLGSLLERALRGE